MCGPCLFGCGDSAQGWAGLAAGRGGSRYDAAAPPRWWLRTPRSPAPLRGGNIKLISLSGVIIVPTFVRLCLVAAAAGEEVIKLVTVTLHNGLNVLKIMHRLVFSLSYTKYLHIP